MQFITSAHAINTLILQNKAFHMEPGGRRMLNKDIGAMSKVYAQAYTHLPKNRSTLKEVHQYFANARELFSYLHLPGFKI